MYRCPTCKSKDNLEVSVQQWALLIQPDKNPEEFECDTDEASSHDMEWGANSTMQCVNAECADAYETHTAEYFECEDEEEEEDDDEVTT